MGRLPVSNRVWSSMRARMRTATQAHRLRPHPPRSLLSRADEFRIRLATPHEGGPNSNASPPPDRAPLTRLERVMGIEPTSSAWKAEVLPLNYTRETVCRGSPAFRPANRRRIRPDPRTLVEGVGFEPTKAEPPDLQSGPFGRSGTPPQHKRRILLNGTGRVKPPRRKDLCKELFQAIPGPAAGRGTDRSTPVRDRLAGTGISRLRLAARRETGARSSHADAESARAGPPRGFPAPASSHTASARAAAATSESTRSFPRTAVRRACHGRRRD